MSILMAESEEELKGFLMKVKEESEKKKKLNIKKKLRSWHPVPSLHANRWGKNGNSDRLYVLGGGGSKITADGDCTHEIKTLLLLGRKAMIDLDSILKSRDITLPTSICLIQAMVFPVLMYGCESWTVQKAAH